MTFGTKPWLFAAECRYGFQFKSEPPQTNYRMIFFKMIKFLSKGSDTLGHTRRNIIEEKSIGDCRRSIFGHVTNRQSGIFAAYQGNENTEFP